MGVRGRKKKATVIMKTARYKRMVKDNGKAIRKGEGEMMGSRSEGEKVRCKRRDHDEVLSA